MPLTNVKGIIIYAEGTSVPDGRNLELEVRPGAGRKTTGARRRGCGKSPILFGGHANVCWKYRNRRRRYRNLDQVRLALMQADRGGSGASPIPGCESRTVSREGRSPGCESSAVRYEACNASCESLNLNRESSNLGRETCNECSVPRNPVRACCNAPGERETINGAFDRPFPAIPQDAGNGAVTACILPDPPNS